MTRARSILGGLAAGALLAAAAWAAETVYLTRQQALDWALPGAEDVRPVPLNLTAAEKDSLRARFHLKFDGEPACFAGYHAGQLAGYALLIDEIGKHRPITFVVAVEPTGVLRDLEVVAYREAIGDGVRKRAFLDQFKGRKPGESLEVGHVIDGVSGATLSCRAAERAARKALALSGLLAARPTEGEVRKP